MDGADAVAPADHLLRLPQMQKKIPGRKRARRSATLTWIVLLKAMWSWSISSCNNLIVYICGRLVALDIGSTLGPILHRPWEDLVLVFPASYNSNGHATLVVC